MTGPERSADARAARRASWPIRIGTLANPPDETPLSGNTVEVRLAMMWSLAVEAWTFAGWKIPDYERAQTPIVIFAPGQTPIRDE